MTETPSAEARSLLEPLRRVHDAVRDAVAAACRAQTTEALSAVAGDDQGDTIFAIDRVSEAALVDLVGRELGAIAPVRLLAEGLPPEGVVLPRGTDPSASRWRVLVDPIDGTRGLMYQKRPAWVLTGVAPDRGDATRLRDVVLAVQTEIPLVKQHLADQLWALRGEGVGAERVHLLSGEREPLTLQPSRAADPRHGYATISRFFPGGRDLLAAVDEAVITGVLGPVPDGKALCFEDQYASSGGQLHELMAGRDRFIADLRPLVSRQLRGRGEGGGMCCHPYDVAAVLIAEELGVIVTDERGDALDAPLSLDADVSWVGYANDRLRERMEPVLQAALRERGWL